MSNSKEEIFEDFLVEKNDMVDYAAHRLLAALCTENAGDVDEYIESGDAEKSGLEWDQSIIGEVVTYAETLLQRRGIGTCHPYYEEDEDGSVTVPCYIGTDCKNARCAMRNGKCGGREA